MIFKQIESGGDRNFAYLIASEKTGYGAIIDPSPDAARVAAAVKKENISVRFVINTHSHYDHSQGNEYFRQPVKDGVVTFINCGELPGVKDGQLLEEGDITFELILTPGHTTDSICIMAGNKLVTGDTLFVGKVGGTYGKEDAVAEFESLKKIISLPAGTEVWPGHDYGVKPHSTIGYELENNPFIKRLDDFAEFLWLKQNWASYKLEHGIK